MPNVTNVTNVTIYSYAYRRNFSGRSGNTDLHPEVVTSVTTHEPKRQAENPSHLSPEPRDRRPPGMHLTWRNPTATTRAGFQVLSNWAGMPLNRQSFGFDSHCLSQRPLGGLS